SLITRYAPVLVSLGPFHSLPYSKPGCGPLRAPPLHFRRQPPQLNYPPGNVPDPDHGPRLENQNDQSGISTMTPHTLACMLQRLPPILHKPSRSPLPSYSEGPGVFPSCCA